LSLHFQWQTKGETNKDEIVPLDPTQDSVNAKESMTDQETDLMMTPPAMAMDFPPLGGLHLWVGVLQERVASPVALFNRLSQYKLLYSFISVDRV